MKKIYSQADVRSAIDKMAAKILRDVSDPREEWAAVGIQTRGVPLARRLSEALSRLGGPALPIGTLDVTFYRDDAAVSSLDAMAQDTDLPFDVNGKTVFLVDDVLFTGRTIRCALDELMDFGRPRRICLAVLVDRGQRELPIQPDFVGETVLTLPGQRVEVRLEEIDGEDAVWIAEKKRVRGREVTA
jgi:pyrimidine operon attenuation protein / uracil phosphoribosyltransferase